MPVATIRIEILGVPVDCLTSAETHRLLDRMLDGKHPHSVIAVNPEKVMSARRNPQLLEQLMRASVLLPDGIGVVLAARWKSGRTVERVTGADVMPEICRLAHRRGSGIFLFGGKEGIAERAAENLEARLPGIRIVGTQHGYIPETEMENLVARIHASGADILFLALGSPRQEQWMARYLPSLNVRLCQGVGGTFDVLAGHVRRAPKAFQMCHGEWLYRLLTDPVRVFRQQALIGYAWLNMKHHLFQGRVEG